MIISSFLETLLLARFSLPDVVEDKKLEKSFNNLNRAVDDWVKQNKLLYGDDVINNPFMHCWFLSIPQLRLVLEGVDGPEAFRNAMLMNKHLTMNTQDFYYEYSQARNLKLTKKS